MFAGEFRGNIKQESAEQESGKEINNEDEDSNPNIQFSIWSKNVCSPRKWKALPATNAEKCRKYREKLKNKIVQEDIKERQKQRERKAYNQQKYRDRIRARNQTDLKGIAAFNNKFSTNEDISNRISNVVKIELGNSGNNNGNYNSNIENENLLKVKKE